MRLGPCLASRLRCPWQGAPIPGCMLGGRWSASRFPVRRPSRRRSLRSLNGVLPHDVAVVAAEAAPDGFDARRDARSRTYRYRVLARPARSPFERDRALWWPHPIDEPALEACARGAAGHA